MQRISDLQKNRKIGTTIIMKQKDLSNSQKLLIGYVVMAIFEFYAVITSLVTNGPSVLQYYTELSNLFSGIICAYGAYILHKEKEITPKVKCLRYISLCLLTITFLVVLFVLAPIYGYVWILLSGTMLFTHTLCPILSAIIFFFFEREPKLNKSDILASIAPTLGYGVVAILLNIVGVLSGPYPFLMVMEQSIGTSVAWFIGLIGSASLISLAYYYWDQKH